ncbi:AraC family transcriptional regulator [Clostridium butyricum]
MNLFDLKDFLNLAEKEYIYKDLYFKYPQFELHKPKTTKHIDSLLKKLDIDVENLKDPNKTSSKKDAMNEKIFPKSNDIIISRHLRYSPCFLHTHSFFEIVFVANGFCKNKVSDTVLEMKKGDVCIIAPNTIHALSVFSDDCIIINLLVRASTFEKSFFEILKSNDVLSSFFSHALYSSNSQSYLMFTEHGDEHTIYSIFEMYNEFNNIDTYSDRILTSMMSAFFIRLLRSDVKNIIVPMNSSTSSDRNVIYILNHIFSNFNNLTLKDLSLKYNYSERQMARILKEYTGKTFINIIQDIKLQKACELLKNPNISINKVIENIGYSNTTHFYKIFKKHYNMSPIDYRNMIQSY